MRRGGEAHGHHRDRENPTGLARPTTSVERSHTRDSRWCVWPLHGITCRAIVTDESPPRSPAPSPVRALNDGA